MSENKLKVKQWLDSARIGDDAMTQDEIIDACSTLMDKAYAHAILGEGVPMFLGEDGKAYVVTVNASISEANPEFLAEVLEDYDMFECEGCHKYFDIEDSVKHGKKGLMYCPACDKVIKET